MCVSCIYVYVCVCIMYIYYGKVVVIHSRICSQCVICGLLGVTGEDMVVISAVLPFTPFQPQFEEVGGLSELVPS